MKIEMTNSRWAYAGVLVLAVAFILYSAWPAKPPAVDTTVLIAEATAKVEAQFKKDIAEKEVAINDYRSRLAVSEAKYKTLAARYNELQKGKDSVVKPTTNTELRERFTALGFAPLPIK
jgi:hypothetical protein